MKSSPRGALRVFDFKEEDALTELAAEKYLEKFKNPNLDSRASLKCDFVECVAPGTNVGRKEVGTIPCVNVDAIDCDRGHDNASSHTTLGAEEENFAAREELSGLGTVMHSNCDEPVGVVSDADESMNANSPSSPTSEIGEDVSLIRCAPDNCYGDMEMVPSLMLFRSGDTDDINVEVMLCPDYVIYRDIYCTSPLLSFSPSRIKISGSTPYGNEGTLDLEWGINDLVDVRCQWMPKIETVILKLHVKAKDEVQVNNGCSTSGVEELKVVIADPRWSEKQEVITSLNGNYSAVWDVVADTDMGMEGANLLGQRHYIPSFDEPFEDVIYPKGDSDAVSISKRDVDLLQPDTFINDTIIDFYIKYLKNQIQPEERHRYHFFNSFFFRKLADMDKDPTSASDGRAAFLRVRKWTRKVDIFEKDYIFIPINFNLHWSLIIICHPGDVARLKDGELSKSPKVPCILHMDSIKGSHTGIKNLIQSYLWEEWKERQKETAEDISSRFLYLRFVSLELPQQENSFDCGLFLLHYLELFLAEAPVNFNPFKIIKCSKFLNVNWFPPAEASLKRTLIQRLIFELLESRNPGVSSAACEEDDPSEFPENLKNETGVEFLSERCGPAIAEQGNISSSQSSQGIEMTLLPACSMNSHCVNNSGLVLKEFLEAGASAGSLLERYPSFGQPSPYFHLNGAISPTEEDVENSDRFVYLSTGDAGIQQTIGVMPQASSIPFSSRDFRGETSYNLGISVQGVHDNVDSSPEASNSASDDSDVGIIENCPVGEDTGTSKKEGTDERTSTPTENFCLGETFISAASKLMMDVSACEGSDNPDAMHDGNGDCGQLCIHRENSLSLFPSHDVIENGEIACNDVLMISDDHIAESDGERAAKRLRLTPPPESDGNEILHPSG